MPIGADTSYSRRDLPHLAKTGKTIFVTFCTEERSILDPSERDLVFACILHDHRRTHWLYCAVVMPDHVHLLLIPYEQWTLSNIVSRIKNVSARRVNAVRRTAGRVWQREWFDRIIRSDEDIRAKAEYVVANPIRAGFVRSLEEYRWVWRSWMDDAPPKSAAPHSAAPHSAAPH